MSSYANFFIKTPDNKFFPVGDYSRNTGIYGIFRDLPYGKVRAINLSEIQSAFDAIEKDIIAVKQSIAREKDQIATIKSFALTPESRDTIMDELRNSQRYIDENYEEIDELNNDYGVILSFLNLINSVRYTSVDNEYRAIDPNAYLYGGIEVEVPVQEVK